MNGKHSNGKVEINSQFGQNFSCYFPYPLLFAYCCLPKETKIAKALFQFSTTWMHDNTPDQSQAHLPFAAGNPWVA